LVFLVAGGQTGKRGDGVEQMRWERVRWLIW